MPNRSARDSPRRSDSSRSGPRRMRNKLFIGNLTKGTSKLDLEREFSRFGRLADIWVSHVPPGFAFIEYFSSKDASECVQALDGRAVLSQKLRVEFAKSEPNDRPVRRKKLAPEVSTSRNSRRSRSPAERVESRPRLLPPPKLSVIGPLSSRRSPSPMLLLRRGGTAYEDVSNIRGAWSSASLLPASIRARSRSPRVRSPALPLPSTSHRESLSSSGRLLAPPPPSAAALFALAGGYASVPAEVLPSYGKHYTSSSSRVRSPVRSSHARSPARSSHVRSPARSGHARSPVRSSRVRIPVRTRSRSPIPGHSRSVVSGVSRSHLMARSHSRSPVHRTKLLGRTPPPPSPSPPRHYGHIGHLMVNEHVSPLRPVHSRSPSPYSLVRAAVAYGNVSPPPRPPVDYQTAAVRWSRSRSGSPTPVRKKMKNERMTPPLAYRLSRSSHRTGSSSSSSRGVSRSLSIRRSISPQVGGRLSPAKHESRTQRLPSPRYSRNEVAPSSRHDVKSSTVRQWSPRKSEHAAVGRRSPSPQAARPRNGGSHSATAPGRSSPTCRSANRRH